MNRMVKNLLALNQLEFGEDDVQFERFDITSLISGVLQSLDILIEQKEAQVIFRHKNLFMSGQMSLRLNRLSGTMSTMH